MNYTGEAGLAARESGWLVMQRCMAIARRLQRGPATKAELLGAVYESAGNDAYGYCDGGALNKRFDGDKRRLRSYLGIHVRYDSAAGGYVLSAHDAPLLELGDDHLQTLAPFLQRARSLPAGRLLPA